jgi:uncharacterized protein YbjT (DUF2867 family)
MGSKTVAIAGASGVVGSRALQHLLACEDVGRVVAVGRRALALRHPKLDARVADLRSAAAIERELPAGVAVAACCLGTTRRQAGSQEAFRAVDRDAVVAFGAAARARGARRLVVVSATGADARSRSFYLRTKGEAEEALAGLGLPELTVLRPSFIDDEGARSEFRLAERVGLPVARAVFAVAGRTRRWAPVRADTVARALVRLALDETSERVRIVESEALHALGR